MTSRKAYSYLYKELVKMGRAVLADRADRAYLRRKNKTLQLKVSRR